MHHDAGEVGADRPLTEGAHAHIPSQLPSSLPNSSLLKT
jgi:hypothetical protein